MSTRYYKLDGVDMSSTLEIVGGIEGGGTHSKLVLITPNGEIISRALGGPTNVYLTGIEGAARTIAEMVVKGKELAGLSAGPLAALGLSLSGMEVQEERESLNQMLKFLYPQLAAQYWICNDAMGALYTASEKGGIIEIAGTGSVSWLVNPAGKRYRCGGWGHHIGDEGSGYYIAKRALTRIFRLSECNGVDKIPYDISFAKDAMLHYFKTATQDGILVPVYKEFNKANIAGFCKILAQGATDGDEFCKSLFTKAGEMLGSMIVGLLRQAKDDPTALPDDGSPVRILCVGSVLEKSFDLLKDGYVGALTKSTPSLSSFELVRLKDTAAIGAAATAAAQSGIELALDRSLLVEVFFTYPPDLLTAIV